MILNLNRFFYIKILMTYLFDNFITVYPIYKIMVQELLL